MFMGLQKQRPLALRSVHVAMGTLWALWIGLAVGHNIVAVYCWQILMTVIIGVVCYALYIIEK
jgi:hypothetical protein